jgi:plastocyanin
MRLLRNVLALGCLAAAGARAQEASVQGMLLVPGGRPAGIVVGLVPEGRSGASPVNTSIDQRGLRFVPSVAAVTPGSVVTFPNSDPVLHNIFIVGPDRGRRDLGTYPTGEFRELTLTQPGIHLVLCHLHPEMAASIVVLDAPHLAVTDSAGAFRFDAVPPGAYRLVVRHRRYGAPSQAMQLAPSEVRKLRLILTPVARGKRPPQEPPTR